MVSAGHEGGTRGSGIMSSAADVIWMRGVGEVCEKCMCLARGGVGGEGDERIGFGLYQSCQNRGSVGRVSVFGLRWYMWGMCRGLGLVPGGLVWCYVCVRCGSGLSV